MGNLIIYLKWRGDFSLYNSSFCEVIIFAEIVF